MTQSYLRIIIHGEKGSGKNFLLDTFTPLLKGEPILIKSNSIGEMAISILETHLNNKKRAPILIEECTDEEISFIIEHVQYVASPLIFITQQTPSETMEKFKGENYRYISPSYNHN